MSEHDSHMVRCLELAALGRENVSPNPMVGSVIVHENKVIGEGYHQAFGQAHAEVNALASVSDRLLLPSSTLYVNLEPCCHFGQTPPCTTAIESSGITRVVVGSVDPNPLVQGGGVKALRESGIEVIVGVLQERCDFFNRRFLTHTRDQRPYTILKWAQTADGFIARSDFTSKWISSERSRSLVHLWRSHEDAVLVGTNTAHYDNPKLTVRAVEGSDPIRVVLDRELRLSKELHLFDGKVRTIVFNEKTDHESQNLEMIQVLFDDTLWMQIMAALASCGVSSLLIEGGAATLQGLLDQDLWDEARVFSSTQAFQEGIRAPTLLRDPIGSVEIAEDQLDLYLSRPTQNRPTQSETAELLTNEILLPSDSRT